jgi:hypothetical protein
MTFTIPEIQTVTISQQRLLFADMAGDPEIIGRGFGDELREHFNDGDANEIIADIASFRGNDKFMSALITYLALYDLESTKISDKQIKVIKPQLTLI